MTDRLCACGCGEPAGVYASSNSQAGIRRGEPKRFIHGHHGRVQSYPNARSQRLLEQHDVDVATGCWIWRHVNQGDDGYGKVWIAGRKVGAHVAVYELLVGPVPEGLQLDHLCRNRACVNPAHMEPVTHAENVRRGANATLTAAQADEIRRRRAAGERGTDLAREYGVRPTTISMIHKGRTWQ
jgi:hypothetical protein